MLDTATVLISDPDPLTVLSLARQGRSMGLAVLTDVCCDVVSLAARFHPATIVLELNQTVDGRDLIARLRQDPATREARILVFSSNSDPYIEQTCRELGASEFILKPSRSRGVMMRAAELAGVRTAYAAA
jgi:two-component system response regulator AdeR